MDTLLQRAPALLGGNLPRGFWRRREPYASPLLSRKLQSSQLICFWTNIGGYYAEVNTSGWGYASGLIISAMLFAKSERRFWLRH